MTDHVTIPADQTRTFVPARTRRMSALWMHPICRDVVPSAINPGTSCRRPECDEYNGPDVRWLQLYIAAEDSRACGPLDEIPARAGRAPIGGTR